MTYGPFRPGDLYAAFARNVPLGGFMLAEGGLLSVAKWPEEEDDDTVYDVLFKYSPDAPPRMVDTLKPPARCLQIQNGRLEASVAGVGVRPTEGCLGINEPGDIALTVRSPGTGNGIFLHLGTGLVSSIEPPGFFAWASTWRLDLVVGETRIQLASHS